MGVRVRVKLRSLQTGREVITVALLNAGYETEKPECLLPVRLAEELEVWPKLPKGARVKNYETAGGPVKMYCIEDGVEVVVVAGDESSKCISNLVVSQIEKEVLLSDAAIEALNIIIDSPLKGLWRFRDSGRLHGSEKPEYW
ncbi:MAG: hypothetical protein LZ168_06035 [Thaumarchaeota archaeon]|jgi:hypothetical protein|nr:hypothetical protein [Candidatus Geocrenenecus arthurdayi]